MLRKPKWQTLVLLVACVVLMGHFLDRLSPGPIITCPKAAMMQQGGLGTVGRDIPNAVDHTPVRPQREPDPLALPDSKLPDSRVSRGNGPEGSVSARGRLPEARVLDLPVDRMQGPATSGLRYNTSGTTRGALPVAWDPQKFELISEMNSTLHLRPWGDQDLADDLCKKKEWYALGPLPDVSVIISFHNNEDLFNIIHTLHAVVKRSPPKLLREIILIDDNTQKDEFVQLLEMHLRIYFGKLVRLVRSNIDLGLIRARLNGIRAALGKVVVVMDSHVEPQKGWLEALLYEIVRDRRTLASPFLDWMQKTDRVWTYRHGASTWLTYFDWTLTFGFQALPAEKLETRSDRTQPIRSPVTVGTVWAMDKTWFEEIGAFDEGMQRWGGENLDLALRVWLFGGQVVNVPCSHVSHLEKDGARNYRNGWTDIIQTNYKRFVEVWLDEYKKYFYLHLPHVESFDAGDLSSRVALKSKAKHNFTWFLENVFPELGVPDLNVYAHGGLQSLGGRCFDTLYSMTPGLSECSPQLIATQGVFWTKEGLLRLPINIVTSEHFNGFSVVKVYEYTSYYNTGRAAKWFHVKNGPLIELNTGRCLEVGKNGELLLSKCKHTLSQYWRFRIYTQDYTQLSIVGDRVPEEFKFYLPLFKAMSQRSNQVTVNIPFFYGQQDP